MIRNHSGFVVPAVIWVVVALGATQLVPSFRPTHWFQKGPPTKELLAAQEQAAKAKQEAVDAEAKYQAALIEQRAKIAAATQYSQQMIFGVPVALQRAPQSPEVILATSLAKRAGNGLSAAIGDLPADKQAEIAGIVAEALSAKQAEVDAAKAALAAKDAELSKISSEKAAVEAKLPVLAEQAKSSDAKATAAQGIVAAKTGEVAAYAEKMAAKEKEAGSLNAFAGSLVRWLIAIGIGYVVIHFVLPSLAAEFPAFKLLQTANKATKSIFSSHA